jgi:drug/metabolite transporter (DMT)-like permease
MSRYALLSSLCGCLASVAGKNAFDSAALTAVATRVCTHLPSSPFPSPSVLPLFLSCPAILLSLLHVASIGGLLVFNSLMLTFLVRALHIKGTVQTITLTSALSFVLSGVVGWLCFGEELSGGWVMGIAVILAGVYLVQRGSAEAEKSAVKAPQR